MGGIEIERTRKALRVIVKTSRPGMIIGKAGDGVVKLRAKILALLHKEKISLSTQEFKLDIEEIRNPEGNSAIVAMMIADALREAFAFPSRDEADIGKGHGE